MNSLAEINEEEWWRVAEQCPYATFFHTPLWSQIACETNDEFNDRTQGYKCDNGTRVILPAVGHNTPVQKFGMSKTIRRFKSTFAGCYGGPIADGEFELSEFPVDSLSNGMDIVSMKSNPIATGVLPKEPFTTDSDFTQLIRLKEFDNYEDVEGSFSKSRRRYVRKSRREGGDVREATSLNDWKTYYAAYEDSLERWDDVSSTYSWEFFKTIYELSQEYPELIKLWLSTVDSEIASGALVFYWGSHADYWHGAADRDYFDANPNGILHAEIIRDAMERGFQYYDFNPSGGHEGVVKFKQKFGTERVPITSYQYESPLYKTAQKVVGLHDSLQ